MSFDAVFEAQKAIYGALVADVPLMALVSGVYDYVPEGTNYPYIVLSNAKTSDISGVSAGKYRIEYQVAAYSRDRGAKNVLDIVAQIDAVLGDLVPSIAGYLALPIDIKEVNHAKQVDGLTYKATATVAIILEKVA